MTEQPINITRGINQGVKETKSVSRSPAGKTTVTVTLTADDGTISKHSAWTYGADITNQYVRSRTQAYDNMAALLKER